MFEKIKQLFSSKQIEEEIIDTKLALAALLVHLAAIDGIVSKEEQKLLSDILQKKFDLNQQEVTSLLQQATKKQQEAVDYYQFTSLLIGLDEKERIDIIRLMWEVVFADGVNHELEDNMVWRIAELIGVSSRERTILRKEIKENKLKQA